MLNESDAPKCESCGKSAMAAFVQHGSYFTRCIACGAEGPATSWLALANQLAGRIRAVVVTPTYEALEEIGIGEVRQMWAAVSSAAHQGKLVRLLNAAPDA